MEIKSNITEHQVFYRNSNNLSFLNDESIQLIITSPPYPMVEMWDQVFSGFNKKIATALEMSNGNQIFSLMHKELDRTWKECYRLLSPGGLLCINIGDGTRKMGDKFKLYSNHYRIIESCHKLGFDTLPLILWRKQTNAPNKFMGSGMLPAGAYVTLEHEYILIFRKGNKRNFTNDKDKLNRHESSYFWEERNIWFSDIWDFKGVKQKIKQSDLRKRSAAFPFELAYRIIQMYSVKGDYILDPFLGTGTTTIAAMASERNSIGIEADSTLSTLIEEKISSSKDFLNEYIKERLNKHSDFIENYSKTKEVKHYNQYHNFPVVTKQEINIKLRSIREIIKIGENSYNVRYDEINS